MGMNQSLRYVLAVQDSVLKSADDVFNAAAMCWRKTNEMLL